MVGNADIMSAHYNILCSQIIGRGKDSEVMRCCWYATAHCALASKACLPPTIAFAQHLGAFSGNRQRNEEGTAFANRALNPDPPAEQFN